MSYLGDGAPEVIPEIDDAQFWEAANEKRLVLQHCHACGTVCHPPRPVCPSCQSSDREWIDAPYCGEIFSFTWSNVAPKGIDPASLPYNIALIAFPGIDDIRLISNVVNATPDTLAIGAVVRTVWERDATGRNLPRFELV